jgi:hypothetical protein
MDTERHGTNSFKRNDKICERGVQRCFPNPIFYATGRVNITKTKNAARKEIKTKSAGHPTNFTVAEEQVLAAKWKDSAGSAFRCTTQQIRRAAFLFANTKCINHPWDKDKISAGKDWFGFLVS